MLVSTRLRSSCQQAAGEKRELGKIWTPAAQLSGLTWRGTLWSAWAERRNELLTKHALVWRETGSLPSLVKRFLWGGARTEHPSRLEMALNNHSFTSSWIWTDSKGDDALYCKPFILTFFFICLKEINFGPKKGHIMTTNKCQTWKLTARKSN